MNNLPKMKTIEEIAKIFSLPKHFVRSAVLNNKIVYKKAGRKTLINQDKFEDWLNAPDNAEFASSTENYGTVRQII